MIWPSQSWNHPEDKTGLIQLGTRDWSTFGREPSLLGIRMQRLPQLCPEEQRRSARWPMRWFQPQGLGGKFLNSEHDSGLKDWTKVPCRRLAVLGLDSGLGF